MQTKTRMVRPAGFFIVRKHHRTPVASLIALCRPARAMRDGAAVGRSQRSADGTAPPRRRARQAGAESWPVGGFGFVRDWWQKKWQAVEISPRPVIRGERPLRNFDQEQAQMADSSDQITRLDLRPGATPGTDPLQAGTAKHKGKSVRVNLSVPAEVDAILSGLATKTGTSKASFVMQALNWYLPTLRVKLAEFDEVQAHIRSKQRLAANGCAVEVSYEWKLPRNERRKLERDRLKAERKKRNQGGQDEP